MTKDGLVTAKDLFDLCSISDGPDEEDCETMAGHVTAVEDDFWRRQKAQNDAGLWEFAKDLMLSDIERLKK